MNRRHLIAGASCALSLPYITGAATPILGLYRQHRQLTVAAYNHHCRDGDLDAELDRLFYVRRDQIEKQIMALPCQSAADFAAKVIVDTCFGSLFDDWADGALWAEARALTETPILFGA